MSRHLETSHWLVQLARIVWDCQEVEGQGSPCRGTAQLSLVVQLVRVVWVCQEVGGRGFRSK